MESSNSQWNRKFTPWLWFHEIFLAANSILEVEGDQLFEWKSKVLSRFAGHMTCFDNPNR